MRVAQWIGLASLGALLAASIPAYAVNEHSEPDEAADRAAILKSQETGQPLKYHLNVPNPNHDPQNVAGSHTPSPTVKAQDREKNE